MNDILAQVNANQEDLAVAVNNPQVITTLTSGSTYTIPSDALAIYIRAAGGGRGGPVFVLVNPEEGPVYISSNGGGQGGTTTVSNTALSLSITAKGGGQTGSSSGGTVQKKKGGAGGRSYQQHSGQYGISIDAGLAGDLVSTYINSSSVAGKSLTYSIGAGGSAGGANAEAGDTGYLEIWVW